MQIDAHFSTLLTQEFWVPQFSMLGPILFNLYVADMSQMTPESEYFQYADDAILYPTCKGSQRYACINSIEKGMYFILSL